MVVGSTYTSDPNDHLLHPSFMNDTSVQQPIHISRNQRDDIPLKILNVNCQSVVGKKASLLNMCETTGADIVIGTESWLSDQHLSTEIFPDDYKVFRRDRKKRKGGGVFIFVKNHLQCMEPEELRIDHDCEMTRVQIKVTGASSLYVGAFYRPPDSDNPDYLAQLDTCLSRIPENAHIWLSGDFNLADIDWTDNSLKGSATKPALCNQLINITADRFLQQLVSQPTRITETTESLLDLFFCNNRSLVNTVEVIPGISDHEAVYIEASLHPHKTPQPQRTVFCYNKADYDSIKKGLYILHRDMSDMLTASVDKLWTMFTKHLSDLMHGRIPAKTLKGRKMKKPWIDGKVRTAIRKKARLYTRMRKTKKQQDIRKYRQCKGDVQKLERQAYYSYINNIIEVNEDHDDKPSKQKQFWSYIKSLRKDNTGISPLKDKGRLFNAPKDKANILNRQYQSTFTQEDTNQVPSPS